MSSGSLPSDLPEVHKTEVDGVPVYWTDEPIPRVGVLMFGVGRSHERAATGGLSHLVEHLALAPLTQQEYSHNGFVAGQRTVIHASGTDEELTTFFGSVTASISELPVGRLGMERRILRQEAQDRSAGIAGMLLWYRFGPRGHGLLNFDELGLGWLGPATVADWATTRFTRENAVMWFSGPPPADLRLSLPSGARPPAIGLEPIDNLRFPAHLALGPARISLSYLAERSTAAVVTIEAIARRARELLRFERGLVYDVQTDYERLDGVTAHCTVSADCQPGQVDVVRDEVLRLIHQIAQDGLTPDELRRASRAFREGLEVPQARLGYLDGLAFDAVAGGRIESLQQLMHEYASLDGPTTADNLRGAVGSLLLCAPGTTPAEGGWTTYNGWSTELLDGRRFRPSGRQVAGFRLPAWGPEPVLSVGKTGVTWLSPDGSVLTVRYDRCVAYRHWEGDVRELWGEDGFRVAIAPSEWHRGVEAVRIVDAAIAPDVVVCDEHGLGAFEDPADKAGEHGAHI